MMQWHSLHECFQTDVWQHGLKNQAVILRIVDYFYLWYSKAVQRLSNYTPKKYFTKEIYIGHNESCGFFFSFSYKRTP